MIKLYSTFAYTRLYTSTNEFIETRTQNIRSHGIQMFFLYIFTHTLTYSTIQRAHKHAFYSNSPQILPKKCTFLTCTIPYALYMMPFAKISSKYSIYVVYTQYSNAQSKNFGFCIFLNDSTLLCLYVAFTVKKQKSGSVPTYIYIHT